MTIVCQLLQNRGTLTCRYQKMHEFILIRNQLVLNHLHLGKCIIAYYLFAILAVCKDEEGSLFLIKDKNGWPLSDCIDCHCEAGFLTCSRTLEINFPGHYFGVYEHNEKCATPQCNVAKFVRENRDYCEGNKSPSVHKDYHIKSITLVCNTYSIFISPWV